MQTPTARPFANCSTAQRKKHTSRFFSKLTLDHGLSGSYCTMRPLVVQAVMRLAWEGRVTPRFARGIQCVADFANESVLLVGWAHCGG
jgi:hypothetical protein